MKYLFHALFLFVETTFHLIEKVHCQNVRIWTLEQLNVTVEYQRYSQKLMFSAQFQEELKEKCL